MVVKIKRRYQYDPVEVALEQYAYRRCLGRIIEYWGTDKAASYITGLRKADIGTIREIDEDLLFLMQITQLRGV